MFFANDAHGKKVYIDDSVPMQSYFCPACGNKMILRRGNIVAHHFAHSAKKECDPWYTKRSANIFWTIFDGLYPFLLRFIFFPALFEASISMCSTSVCGYLCGQEIDRIPKALS